MDRFVLSCSIYTLRKVFLQFHITGKLRIGRTRQKIGKGIDQELKINNFLSCLSSFMPELTTEITLAPGTRSASIHQAFTSSVKLQSIAACLNQPGRLSACLGKLLMSEFRAEDGLGLPWKHTPCCPK